MKNGQKLSMLYLKIVVPQIADVFKFFFETSILEYSLNHFYSYSLPGYTWKAGLKLINIKLDYIKDTAKLASAKHLLLLLENNIRGVISSVMSDRYVQSRSGVESEEINKFLYIDANIFYRWAMCQPLPTAEFKSYLSIRVITQMITIYIN